ncbi:MAG: hypothetical protein IH898_07715 [Planctomycetes bacterium]|nr:hypothetical protein [Planctomycetota bacterium]
MNTQELHDGFQTELVRRGLPADYASSAAAELADHHRDVAEELRATGLDNSAAETEAVNRLGDRRLLVKKSVREFQRRHWCGRWPLLTFLFGPLVLLIATWVGTYLVLALVVVGVMKLAGIEDPSNDGIVSTSEYLIMYGFIGWCVFVMPAAVLLFLSRRASRAGLNWQWVFLAALVLAVHVGTFKCGYVDQFSGNPVNLETGEPLGADMMMMSIPYFYMSSSPRSAWAWFASNPQQLCQLLLPLVVAGLVIWRSRHMTHRWKQGLGFVC